jgi:hypothetical protein
MTIVGSIRYATSIITFVLQELSDIIWNLKEKITDPAATQSYIATNHTPAIHLLLSSLPRKLLRGLISQLSSIWTTAHRHYQQTSGSEATRPVAAKWRDFLGAAFKNTPIGPLLGDTRNQPLDTFFKALDALVADAYVKAGLDDAKRARAENRAFVRAVLPVPLSGLVAPLLSRAPNLIALVEGRALHQADVGLLGLGADGTPGRSGLMSNGKKKRRWDVIRKVEVVGKGKVRRCPRCGSETEEMDGTPPWVAGNMKLCICLGHWVALEETVERDAKRIKREE